MNDNAKPKEKQIISYRLIHNSSSPQLLFSERNTIKNRKFNINKNKITLSSFSNSKYFKNILTPLNKSTIEINNYNNNNIENNNLNVTKYMDHYFSAQESLDKSNTNEINDEIDINKILTFYSKKKFNKEKEQIQKVLKKQKLSIQNYNYNSLNKRNNSINKLNYNSLDLSNNNDIDNNKVNSPKNSKIKFDISKIIYHSPIHSFDMVNKNKIIYNNIIKNYLNNTIKSFQDFQNNQSPLLKFKNSQKNKFHQTKIRILPYIPKNLGNSNEKEEEQTESKRDIIQEAKKSNEEKSLAKEIISVLGIAKLLSQKISEKYLLQNKIEYPTKNFPESRCQFIFAQEGFEYILFGGYNVSRKNNLWKFIPSKNYWQNIEPVGIKNEIRYAHTGILRYRNLYIFGGKYFQDPTYGDIEIFNLDKKIWIFPKLESKLRIPLRRNHIACGVGNHMFIHGGISDEGLYLNDQYILNYKPLKWEELDINKDINLPAMAYHSCCLVVPEIIKNNSKFSIYKIPEIISGSDDNIREKGIYVFGGKLSEEGNLNDNLYVLKIGKKPVEWIIINTIGMKPIDRCDNSLTYYESGNFIIVHGGRTFFRKYESPLNDMYILDLFSFNWIEIEYFYKNPKVPRRYFHQAVIYKNFLYVFGGIDGKNYIGSEMLVIDLESNFKCTREKEQIKKLYDGINFNNYNNEKKENKNENDKNVKKDRLHYLGFLRKKKQEGDNKDKNEKKDINKNKNNDDKFDLFSIFK